MKKFNVFSSLSALARFTSKAILVLLLFSSSMTAIQAQVTIQTDASWQCFPLPRPLSNPPYPATSTFADPPAGWRTTTGLGGGWVNSAANGNNIWATVPSPSTIANYVWAAGFRRNFQLTAANIAGFHTLTILVNNGADIWINGNFLASSNWVSNTQTFCIPSNFLVVGNNIIAVKAFEYLDFSSSLNISATFGQAPNASIQSNVPICVGSLINLTTTLTGSTVGLTFRWTGPNGFTSNIQNPVIANATAAMSGIYTLQIQNAAGCTQTLTTTVVVNPLPVVTISGNTIICAGSSTILTASGGGTYKWSTGATMAAITTVAAGTYSVTVTSPNGCTATKSVTVVVNPLPVVTISGNLVMCAGTPTTLTATGGGTYKWSTGATTAAITASAVGTYSVTVTSPNGCTATKSVTTTSNTANCCCEKAVIATTQETCCSQINIGCAIRSVTVSLAGGTFTSLSGPCINTPRGFVGLSTYTLIPATDCASTSVNTCFQSTGLGSVTITYNITFADGTTCVKSEIKKCCCTPKITVPETGCKGVPVKFSVEGNCKIEKAIWYFGDGTTSNEINTTHTYLATGGYEVTFYYVDACGEHKISYGIKILECPCYVKPCIYVKFNGLEANFSGNLSTSNYPIASYHWDFGDGTWANGINPVHTYAKSGSYEVCLTIYADNGVNICECVEKVCMKIEVKEGYLWNNTSCEYRPIAPSTAPPASSSNSNTNATSLKMSVFPNPVSDNLTVVFDKQVSDTEGVTSQLELYNLQGQLIKQQPLEAGFDETKVSMQQLPAGVYMISLRQNGQIISSAKVTKN